jgi:hypothetical protein
MNHMRMAALSLMAALAAGCGSSAPTVVDVGGVAVELTITVQDDGAGMPGAPSGTVELTVGQSISLGAVGTNALGLAVGDVAVTWSTSDAAVGEVTADGVVTAVGEGSAEVQASAGELSATRAVVVAAPAS